MSEANVSFGYRCTRCGSTFGALVQVGQAERDCPRCGGPLVPATGPTAPESLANYTCPKCHSTFGLIVSPGGPITACPNCGHPIN